MITKYRPLAWLMILFFVHVASCAVHIFVVWDYLCKIYGPPVLGWADPIALLFECYWKLSIFISLLATIVFLRRPVTIGELTFIAVVAFVGLTMILGTALKFGNYVLYEMDPWASFWGDFYFAAHYGFAMTLGLVLAIYIRDRKAIKGVK